MNSFRVRAAFVVTMWTVASLALAAPAVAAPGTSGTAVLADDQFKWFYWIGFLLAASLALWLLATLAGYYFKVIRPKHRGRETS
ncbi:MAG TPA: hypothetical protein VK549_08700 [Acidimicrobiia bacterium]|nr:hypothetical protein [Acidimicrobiia bacterium]